MHPEERFGAPPRAAYRRCTTAGEHPGRANQEETRSLTMPVRQSEERLTESLRLRLTLAEAERLRAVAAEAGITVSDFLRRRACGYKVPAPRQHRAFDPAMVSEVNRLGVEIKKVGNLANQVALAAHTGRRSRVVWDEVAEQIGSALAEVHAVLERLLADEDLGNDSPDGEAL